jgi:hypothetical protein
MSWPPPHPQPYPAAAIPPRKRRRVFLWVFLAVQVVFVVWVIGGIASGHGAAAGCHDQYLTRQQCASASEAGTAIGVGLVIVFWAAADVILGVGYGVYKIARRPA